MLNADLKSKHKINYFEATSSATQNSRTNNKRYLDNDISDISFIIVEFTSFCKCFYPENGSSMTRWYLVTHLPEHTFTWPRRPQYKFSNFNNLTWERFLFLLFYICPLWFFVWKTSDVISSSYLFSSAIVWIWITRVSLAFLQHFYFLSAKISQRCIRICVVVLLASWVTHQYFPSQIF